MKVTVIIPTRFLLILSHLVMLVTIIQTRGHNVKAGLPLDYTIEEYGKQDSQFLGGLVAGIVLTVFELLGFFSGVSMFSTTPSVISILCHVGGLASLVFFWLDGWDSTLYWLIFTICTAVPSLIEISVITSVVCWQKRI